MIRDKRLTSEAAAQLIEELATPQPPGVGPVDDSVESAADVDIQDILPLLDQVWPRNDSARERTPRQFGRFSIKSELGRGGFGVVYLAEECEDDSANQRAWEDGNVALWVPRICDFGMAKLREAEGDDTSSRVACGSPSYMAPEQAEARQTEIGFETDVLFTPPSFSNEARPASRSTRSRRRRSTRRA